MICFSSPLSINTHTQGLAFKGEGGRDDERWDDDVVVLVVVVRGKEGDPVFNPRRWKAWHIPPSLLLVYRRRRHRGTVGAAFVFTWREEETEEKKEKVRPRYNYRFSFRGSTWADADASDITTKGGTHFIRWWWWWWWWWYVVATVEVCKAKARVGGFGLHQAVWLSFHLKKDGGENG